MRASLLLYLAAAATASADSLFEGDAALDVRLSGPLSEVIDGKDDREERRFTLAVGAFEYDVDVRARGRSRLRVCEFPPLRLEFGEVPADSPFSGQDRLKLVTPCRDGERAQTDTLEEYAAYRIFNLMAEAGYRVRLLHITYEDTAADPRDVSPRYGFVIESDDGLARRIGGRVAEVEGVRLGSLDTRQAAAMYVFQYLIANTDWSLVMADTDDVCCHNVDLIERNGDLLPIPYDFDQAGFVNARYARPDRSIGISRVTQRRYRGYCMDSTHIADAVAKAVMLRNEITAIAEGVPELDDRAEERVARFLEPFFEEAGDSDRLLGSFERRCL